MIIQGLMDLIYNILNLLMVFEIPKLPAQATEYITTFFSYLTMGAQILANYTPFTYLMVLFGLLLAVDAGIMVYHFIMWVLRKIPLAGIS